MMISARRGWLVLSVLLLVLLAPQPGRADQPVPWPVWFDAVAGHLRTAAGYLRTENGDLAALSIEELIATMDKVRSGKVTLPAPARETGLEPTIAQASQEAADALREVDGGELGKARVRLLAVRETLHAANLANGQTLLPDCVWQLRKLGGPIWAMRQTMPDMSTDGGADHVRITASAYVEKLKACDALAPDAIRSDARFRRLADDALAALALVPETVDQNDPARLIRIIRELQSLDNLLFFRFG